MTPRLAIADLDCEHAWSGGRATPSQAALRSASALGTLLRILCRDGDRLWTPAPVDPQRVPETRGIARPDLVSGRVPLAPGEDPPAAILAWGETPLVEEARRRVVPDDDAAAAADLADLLWRAPASSAAIAAAVNHRAFALEVARDLDCALPGVRACRDADEALRHAASLDADICVAKAPIAAAGRARLVFARDAATIATVRVRLERLIETAGLVVVEPWRARTFDFAGGGVVLGPEPRHVVVAGMHRLFVKGRGRFRAVEVGSRGGAGAVPGLDPDVAARFPDVLQGVGERLAARGYRGPFGVDGYLFTGMGGKPGVQYLSDLNARLTFGLLGHALARRLDREGAGIRVRLAVAHPQDAEGASDAAADPRPPAARDAPRPERVDLLLPDAADRTAAWLEIRRAPAG